MRTSSLSLTLAISLLFTPSIAFADTLAVVGGAGHGPRERARRDSPCADQRTVESFA